MYTYRYIYIYVYMSMYIYICTYVRVQKGSAIVGDLV